MDNANQTRILKLVKEFHRSEIVGWGQALAKFEGAFGTGHPVSNPPEEGLGLDGHMWAHIPITTTQALSAWENNGMNNSHPESAYHQINTSQKLYVAINAYKIKRSILAGSFYANVMNLMIDEGRITFGWFSTMSTLGTFETFDIWLKSGYGNVEDSLESLLEGMGVL